MQVPAITRALAQLAADPGRRATLGAAGRRTAERFSWTRAAALHTEIYERALFQQRSPQPRPAQPHVARQA
jgi:glycosyltransferase involved in cell wall biosynthesis